MDLLAPQAPAAGLDIDVDVGVDVGVEVDVDVAVDVDGAVVWLE